ncbi:MAG: ribose-phosphate pyrophosphokinase [Leptospiraceae bacterium]|nr:ribose-phosphate pyrophosphokinase [Leptospiraceae bacterium]
MSYELLIFSGGANPMLAGEIAQYLGTRLSQATIKKFSDGEISVKIEENIRGRDVFIVQPTSEPANDHLMELFLMLDAIRRASAKRITAVIPYYGYGRQDRKSEPRVPISARVVADLIESMGPNRLLTMDLHADQIQGFFKVPVDHLYAAPVFVKYLNEKKLQDPVVVSPDSGGVERARFLARQIGAGLAIIDKRRPRANVSEVMHVIGDVKDRNCILFDDMIDTGGTITKAAAALKANGASSVMAAATHAVLSGPAVERLQESSIDEVIFTNSIQLPDSKKIEKITQLSVAGLVGEAIRRIHNEESVSSLFL